MSRGNGWNDLLVVRNKFNYTIYLFISYLFINKKFWSEKIWFCQKSEELQDPVIMHISIHTVFHLCKASSSLVHLDKSWYIQGGMVVDPQFLLKCWYLSTSFFSLIMIPAMLYFFTYVVNVSQRRRGPLSSHHATFSLEKVCNRKNIGC